MTNWRKWIWPGILATAVLTALAMIMKSNSIEDDLQSKALDSLKADHHWAKIESDGRDLTLSGMAPSEEAIESAMSVSEGAYGVRMSQSNAELLPEANPFTFSAAKEGNRLVLDGHVPWGDARASVVEAAGAALPGGEIIDNLKTARGAPDGFADLAGFGIGQLANLARGKATLSNMDLSLEGEAGDRASFKAINTALAGAIPGGGKVALAEIGPPSVSPYTFAAIESEAGIVLKGHVPDEETRQALFAAAGKATEGTVTNNMRLASGAPAGFTDLAGFGIDQLGKLSAGSVNLSDLDFSVSGTPLNAEAQEALNSALSGDLPGGGKLASVELRSPIIKPYTWSYVNTEGAAPMISGYGPNDKQIADTVERIEARLGSAMAVDNKVKVAPGAPDGFDAATATAIQFASRLVNGRVDISDTEVTLTGEAYSRVAANEIRDQLESALPSGFNGKHTINVINAQEMPSVSIDECQRLLIEPLRHNSIRFEIGETAVKPASYALLDRLSLVLKRCPTAIVEISGHTDSDGADEENQKLSEMRANSVRNYLLNAGVFSGKLSAVGYGAKKPIADNATEEGKAQNRRIEFTVTR